MKEWVDKKKEWMYENKFGRVFLNFIIKRKMTSKLAGKFADSNVSRKMIKTFVRDYNIDINPKTSPFIIPAGGFKTLNELFTRNYKKDRISFSKNKNLLCNPIEGYITIQENINENSIVQAKGFTYKLRELINEDSNIFRGGTLIRIRLTPHEYHWFHYLDDAFILGFKRIKGFSYTAENISLKTIKNMFCKSVRNITILETENFGRVVYIEIGSTFVSSILQNNNIRDNVKKGAKKGCFKFGGSTVILLFEKDKIKINKNIIKAAKNHREIYTKIGKIIGRKA